MSCRVGALRLAGSAVLLLCASVGAQTPPVVRGIVTDSSSGVGIISAEIRLEGGVQVTYTNERGEFRLPMSATSGHLLVRRLGFLPAYLPVRAGEAGVRIALTPAAQRLARVVVRGERGQYIGRLAGYYERLESHAQGQFITRTDLEREKPPQLSDMLQRQPGLRLSHARPGAARILMRGRECTPLVWLDGAALSAGEVDLDAFDPTTLEGIELYLGSNVPARFQWVRGKGECGTIVLWSRGPDTEPKRLGKSITPEALEQLLSSQAVYTAEQVDSVARMDPAHQLDVRYPQSLRAAHVEGTVLAEFVVDTLGQVEPERFEIVGSTDPLFSDAVRDAIRSAVFTPAMRGGRRVRQLVRQPFEFRIPRTRP